MKEIMENALSAIILAESGKVVSKLEGRRNYVIRLEMNDKEAVVDGYGIMNRCGLMGASFKYMARHGTTWVEFTYKKDFMDAVNALKENGFYIDWVD